MPDAPNALAALTAAGVPNFRTPEACGDVVAAAFARRKPRATAAVPHATGHGRLLNELDAYAQLDRVGIAHAPCVAADAKSGAPAHAIAYPVAVKILSDTIAHKTDAGGVVLGVQNEHDLASAIADIRKNVERHVPGTTADRVLVQQMIKGLGEVLIGYRIDGQVGPIVMLAAGGVLTEIYRDRSLRLAPVDLATAQEMIGEVKVLQALTGYRGKPRGDLDALAHAIVALSRFAVISDPVVLEAEINPLMVMQHGIIAVDALVRLA